MKKNPHYKILKEKFKEHHLNIVPKSCSLWANMWSCAPF